MSVTAIRRVPSPKNEPVKSYAPGSPERAELKARLQSMSGERVDIPLVIDGQRVGTSHRAPVVSPHNHRHVIADAHDASPEHVQAAIDAAKRAQRQWASG